MININNYILEKLHIHQDSKPSVFGNLVPVKTDFIKNNYEINREFEENCRKVTDQDRLNNIKEGDVVTVLEFSKEDIKFTGEYKLKVYLISDVRLCIKKIGKIPHNLEEALRTGYDVDINERKEYYKYVYLMHDCKKSIYAVVWSDNNVESFKNWFEYYYNKTDTIWQSSDLSKIKKYFDDNYDNDVKYKLYTRQSLIVRPTENCVNYLSLRKNDSDEYEIQITKKDKWNMNIRDKYNDKFTQIHGFEKFMKTLDEEIQKRIGSRDVRELDFKRKK